MRIAAAQPLIVAYDVAANAVTHAEAVRRSGARVVVFPELSLTGYELDAPVLDPADPRLGPLVEACAETGAVALAGAPVEGPCIGTLAVDGEGARVVYRKMYVDDGTEGLRFVNGDKPGVLEVDGRRLGLAICRDTRFPEHAAATAALGIDAYVASVLETDDRAHVQVERAQRVIADHGVWVVTASYAGSTGGGFDVAAGRSAIWAPDGSVAAEVGTEPGAIAVATLSV
ncbi:carbon-nitrogen hydrolase family protein [Nonomuraea sp. NPDC050556]|uniref:carbon-nitrogen hydrolase family protein n=1 Tax=Nonomuraea sp. NPDC050556 TaxID=3364369 RepID=UPI003789ED5A